MTTSNPFPGSFGAAIAWSPSLGTWCAGSDGDETATSADGVNWTAPVSMSLGGVTDICWSETLGKFVAVGANGLKSSVDGTTWSSLVTPATLGFTGSGFPIGCCADDDDGIVVVVGASGSGTKSITKSSDLSAWSTASGGASGDNWFGVTFAPAPTSLFVVVGINAAQTDAVMTSTDASTWTTQGNPFGTYSVSSAQGYAVAWSPDIGLFVAVASVDDVAEPTGDSIASSPDGATWTGGGNPFSSGDGFNEGRGVAAGTIGGVPQFQAVGWNNNGGVQLSSLDGLVWTAGTSPFGSAGEAVAFGVTAFLSVGGVDPSASFDVGAATTQYQRIYGWRLNISDDALETVDPMLTSPQAGTNA